MSPSPARPTPGIRFETAALPISEVLPRMDVAAFVGFAAKGPLNTPVAVEDAESFSSIFGDDLPLAWDAEAGAMTHAHLAPAVRAFFRNGGRRCVAVRVAREVAPARFLLPGVVQLSFSAASAAAVCASSLGSWADTLRVGTALQVRRISFKDPPTPPDPNVPYVFTLLVTRNDDVSPGCLLRVQYLNQTDEVMLAVDSTKELGQELVAGRQYRRIEVKCWVGVSLTLITEQQSEVLRDLSVARVLDGSSDPAVSVDDSRTEALPNGETVLYVTGDVEALAEGSAVLELEKGQTSYLFRSLTARRTSVVTGNPPQAQFRLQGKLWKRERITGPGGARLQSVELLSLTLFVRSSTGTPIALDALAFSGPHMRFWGTLPNDEQLYGNAAPNGEALAPAWRSLVSRITSPRFPLAGLAENTAFSFPLGMTALPEPFVGARLVRSASGRILSSLERNGLDELGAGLFLDAGAESGNDWGLVQERTTTLLGQADAMQQLGPVPRRLRGIHALLAMDEVTIIAVPDAVHRAWKSGGLGALTPSELPALPSELSESDFQPCLKTTLPVLAFSHQPEPDASGSFILSWQLQSQIQAFRIQTSTNADFSDLIPLEPDVVPVTNYTLPAVTAADCYYYRVRAESGELIGAWSVPLIRHVGAGAAEDCVLPTATETGDLIRLAEVAFDISSIEQDTGAAIDASWRVIDPAWLFRVEQSIQPDFAASVTDWVTYAPSTTLPAVPSGNYFYRVRVEAGAVFGPWSAPIARSVGSPGTVPAFIESNESVEPNVLPQLAFVLQGRQITQTTPEEVAISWTVVDVRWSFRLEEATRGDFTDAVVLYEGKAMSVPVLARRPGHYHYRVCAVVDDIEGRWSHGIVCAVPKSEWIVDSSRDASLMDRMLAVHRCLLRLCAARGDVFAIVSMPRHFRDVEVESYMNLLTADPDTLREPSASPPLALDSVAARVQPLGRDELLAWSFGAMYHPWTVARDEGRGANLVTGPPDGPIAGMLAARSIASGAWVAPARRPLAGVVALTPGLNRNEVATIDEAGVNVLVQEPRGFSTTSANTLSPDPEYADIHVRRLLSLLRRAAMRQGAKYVFEPNDDVLRRTVERDFGELLDVLFARGAFAGSSRETSYQVNVTATSDRLQDIDAGRFIAELKVAPAMPLTFITVRLVQSDARAVIQESK